MCLRSFKILARNLEFKDKVVDEFKDMEVDVKNWNFSFGKTDDGHTLEFNLKLGIKPKKEQLSSITLFHGQSL